MSGEELSKHLGRQMSIHTEIYKEPNFEEELAESKEKKKLKRIASKIKQQQSHHRVILEGSVHKGVTAMQSEDEEVPDDEEQENIKKMKEKEHDELVQGLLLLRDYYKAEYKKALQDKVNHQRKDLQQRERKLEQETRVLAQHHQEMKHKVVHKLPKSIVVNDTQLRDGLQTDYYKIISVENQLKKEGYLTKSHEIREFWAFITVPKKLGNCSGRWTTFVGKNQKLPQRTEKVVTGEPRTNKRNRAAAKTCSQEKVKRCGRRIVMEEYNPWHPDNTYSVRCSFRNHKRSSQVKLLWLKR